MQRQKTIAMMVALIMSSTATAYALNVGVINATRPKPAAASTAVSEPEVTTVVVNVPYDTGPATTLSAVEPTTTTEAPQQPVVAPASTAVPTPVPTAAPTPAPTAAPTTAAVQQQTTYETFTAGPAGEIVLSHTGNTIEFWAAYTANGWNYRVEKAAGQEVVVKYRLGESEMAFVAKVKGGRISTLIEGPSGGGGEDD